MRRLSKRRIILLAVGVVALLALVYYLGTLWESSMEKDEERGDIKQDLAFEDTLEINGVTYRRRKDVTTILLLGTDQEGEQEIISKNNRNGNRADFLRLLVLDSGRDKITQVQIDRDTMTPITILGVLGNRSGMRTAQIALAYTIGDGKEVSCSLTAEAVSNLLLGTSIDFYMTLSMEGITALNDAVGGVTVQIADDFSAFDATMVPGATVTLHGDQAELFVRSRRSIGVGTNEGRMRRQEEYMSKLLSAMTQREKQDKDFVGTIFDALSPYLITNISRGRLINEVWAAKDYDQSRVIALSGEHRIRETGTGDTTMEFYADEQSVQNLVLDLFYEEVK